MSSTAMSLKARIRNFAKTNKISAQVVLQNYMFERFLERVSQSPYKDKFILKGGMLVASIIGLDSRSTMDMDTTLRGYPLEKDKLIEAIYNICSIDVNDSVVFSFISIVPIRDDDEYGGYRASIKAIYDTIITPMQIDITTGDIITPREILYEFGMIFENRKIEVWAYNIETVLAEKYETILRRGVFNTRPRDFYDIYILLKTQNYDKTVFKKALIATATHRKSAEIIADSATIIRTIEKSDSLMNLWSKYQKDYSYAIGISYGDIIAMLKKLST